MSSVKMLFAYVAPQTCLPLASALAAVVGVVLMVDAKRCRFIARWVRPAPTRKSPG